MTRTPVVSAVRLIGRAVLLSAPPAFSFASLQHRYHVFHFACPGQIDAGSVCPLLQFTVCKFRPNTAVWPGKKSG